MAVRRLTGAKRGSFDLKGSNWFERRDQPTAATWRADLTLLEQSHRAFRTVVAGMTARELAHTPVGSEFSNAGLISGVAAHDLYHAGQIQLLKRLMKVEKSKSAGSRQASAK